MLLAFNVVAGAMLENRCVLSRMVLDSAEYVISRARIPTLYSDKLSTDDKAKMKEIVRLLVVNGEEVRRLFSIDAGLRLRVRNFFGLCLSHGDAGDEAILHAYTFLYWDEIVKEAGFARKLHTTPRWGSREFAISSEGLPSSEKQIYDKLVGAGVQVDLFTCDADTQTLTLVEIKRGECDDRAVGQLLRYYQLAWKLLSTAEFRRLNLNYIWPVLVVSRMREEQLAAMPLHFRGLLDILVYETSTENIPRFTSFRKAAISGRWL